MTHHSTSATATDAMAETFCPRCGYSLRGLVERRCPECGLVVDEATLGRADIPWEHRGTVGPWRAYWRTVWKTTLHPVLFAREAAKPVSYGDARRFQLLTVTLTWLPAAVAAVWLYVRSIETPHLRGMAALGWALEWTAVGAFLTAMWLFILMATGVQSYLFHPRRLSVEQQDRAIAISYYACGPLAWGTLLAVGSVVGGLGIEAGGALATVGWVVLAATVVAGLVPPTLVYMNDLIFLKRATHCGIGRLAVMAVGLPVAWVLLGFVAGLLPAAVAYVSLFVLSLWG